MMRYIKNILVCLILSPVLAIPMSGCGKRSDKDDQAQQEGMDENRDTFLRSVSESLTAFDRKIQELEGSLKDDFSEGRRRSLEELRQARADLEARYQEAQQATEDKWRDARRETMSALQALEQRYNRLLEEAQTGSGESPPHE